MPTTPSTNVYLVVEPLLDNPRRLGAKVAAVLGGTAVERPKLTGFLNSEYDPFLNQLFAAGPVTPREAAEALAGHPGFVWLAEEPRPGEIGAPGLESLQLVVMHAMTAATGGPSGAPQIEGEIVEVRSRSELRAWHEVLCQVFGVDGRSRPEWQRVHDALGPAGDRSLLLLLVRVDASPAATGGVFFDRDAAGLYCFTTRERMRRRGLASALVHACHAAARARGVERALLQATAEASSVYARAGYREQRTLPVLVARLARASQVTVRRADSTG